MYTVNGKIDTTLTVTCKNIYNGKYFECIETIKLNIEGKTATLTDKQLGLIYENSTIYGNTDSTIKVEKIVGYK